jgi:uncharacterized RDD family membrane protein YckC
MKKAELFLRRSVALGIDLTAFYLPARIAGFGHGELAILWLLYETVMLSQWQGQTIGKNVMGLKVISKGTQLVPFSKAFIRAIVKVISTVVFLAGDLWVLKDKQSQAWHDRAAGTRVVPSVK